MSLLRDIQNSAVDTHVPLTSLLRKCKVLAARLGSKEFKVWIDNELNGYSSKEGVPQYRVLRVNSKGHFSGPFQTGLRNADIPLSCIPEQFRENLRTSYLMEPIAALESLVENADSGLAQEPWNPDLVVYVGQQIYDGMNCMQAWKVIPINSVVASLDSVRTRILNFVLEIETEDPDAGEAPVNSVPVPPEKVTQIFNTYITGNVGNVATGGKNFNQETRLAEHDKELFAQILNALSRSTADTKAIERLSAMVEEMRDADEPERFTASYQQFMSTLADHMQILGPVLAPYLPALSALLPK